MSESPVELIEQFLIDNTKIGRANFFASEIVASALADYEIIPRAQYEALVTAVKALVMVYNISQRRQHDAWVRAGEALLALHAAGIQIEGEGK